VRRIALQLPHSVRYALEALVFLAGRPPGAIVPSHVIAKGRGLPERYLLKVLEPLVGGGVLRSVKGPNGGYRLTRPAAEVTLLDVVRLLDPDLPEPGASHGARLDPVLAEVTAEAAKALQGVLRRWTVADCLAADRKAGRKKK
jgi:Rrf2 family protein